MTKAHQRESVILRSLPISRKLKRFVTLKFDWLVRHNGPKYASDVFSEYRTLLLGYLSGEVSQDTFISEQRLSKKFSLEILPSVRSNPHTWLDLLKIYTSFAEPVQPVVSSSRDTHQRINRRASEEAIQHSRLISAANVEHDSNDRLRSVVREAFASMIKARENPVLPGPSWYCDVWNYTSDQYQDDFLCAHDLMFDKALGPVMAPVMDLVDTDFDFVEGGFDLTPVGQIHHIPKKGTVKRRAIAVPNRFLQSSLEPLQKYVWAFLRRMPEDCSFDQNKFTSVVSQKLREGDYVGSADLSAASDNLPREIGMSYLRMTSNYLPDPEKGIVEEYLNAFEATCEGLWENGEFFDSFQVGQPLGTLPSFPILALSNHLVCRSLIAGLYGRYMPGMYAVLGDDVIFFDELLREYYIKLMEKLETPMSLHKSYAGRLVEFAGRIFIRNQPPSYSPDHAIVHYGNLFDYQRASKVVIPWNNLPKKIRKRWARNLSSTQAQKAYTIVQALEVGVAPSAVFNSEVLIDTVTNLVLAKAEKLDPPQSDTKAHLTPVYGKLVNTAIKDGYTIRDKSTEPADWFKSKVRPYSTDALRSAVVQAILSPNSH